MKLSRALSAGLFDSGFASLATFALNLYAIGRWESAAPELLGIYFLFMTALFMAAATPFQLMYVPAEKASLALPPSARLGLLNRVLVISLPVVVLSGAIVVLPVIVGLARDFSVADQIPFLVTAAIATMFSPMQNYSRRLLHLAGKSWSAAAVSMVQFSVAMVSLFGMLALDVSPRWLPIGSLALANIASVTVALVISHLTVRQLTAEDTVALTDVLAGISFGSLTTPGRWLVTTSIVSTGTNFLVESLVTLLAGPVALALAGSAKTVAQPVLVLSMGLRSVLGPRSLEAAAARDRPAARRVARTYYRLTAFAVVLYSAVAGFSWALNPLSALVEQAYTVPGLVLLSIFAAGLNAAVVPDRTELIGAGRESALFKAETLTNSIQLAIAAVLAALSGAATNLGAFARPVAFAALGGSRLVTFRRALDRYYGDSNKAAADLTRSESKA